MKNVILLLGSDWMDQSDLSVLYYRLIFGPDLVLRFGVEVSGIVAFM